MPTESLQVLPLGCRVPETLLASRPGGAAISTVRQSHFDQPLSGSKLGGKSRRWGDADWETQAAAINMLIAESRKAGLSLEETAFVLGIVRLESGFNPDAASQRSSASGLGQFIDRTGSAYGLNPGTRFSPASGAKAVVSYVKDCFNRVDREQRKEAADMRFVRAYAVYHDGPDYTDAGIHLAKRHVVPWAEKFYGWLISPSCGVER